MFFLNFHGIGAPKRELPRSEERVWIDEPHFHAILDYVQTRSDVELTFDDANDSDFTIALPALRSRGLKAQFFLVAARIDEPAFLSRNQVKGLLSAGMGLGSHGLHHRPWARLGKRELHEEIIEARDRLEQLAGVKIEHASCPFGSYNRRVLQALRSAGYKCIYTSDGGPAQRGAFIQPRNSVYNTWTAETLKPLLSEEAAPLHRLWRTLKLAMKRWR